MFTCITNTQSNIMNTSFQVSCGLPHTQICTYTCVRYRIETHDATCPAVCFAPTPALNLLRMHYTHFSAP